MLTTNLPVGFDGSIFLRVDESRVDVIKVRLFSFVKPLASFSTN